MKKLFSLLLVLSLLTGCCLTVQADNAVGVSIDGRAVAFTQNSGSPFIDSNSRTLVPLRAVMEAYGCTVGWNQDDHIATVTLEDAKVSVPIGENAIQIGDTAIAIDTAAQLIHGRTYLPIRAVLEAFGAAVGWDGTNRTVTVRHPENAGLRVHFIDVGQADCILITVGAEAMLIDAGNNEDAETILTYLCSKGIRQLNYAVGTHPHEDHIGSLDAVINAIPIENLLMPKVQSNTKTFEDVLDAALTKGYPITAPQLGDCYALGNATLTTVSNYAGDDLNNASIMLRLDYGSQSFLFTGDAEEEAEAAALESGISLDCDVLKAGHHGSRTSSSTDFLAAVTPGYAVITCGRDNNYGHPHQEALDALAATGADIFRTDTQGTILAASDGETITWSTAPAIKGAETPVAVSYVLNTNTMKFHVPTCSSVPKITAENRGDSSLSRNEIIATGYAPCGNCKP